MKTEHIILFLLISLAVLHGCGSKSANESTTEPAKAVAADAKIIPVKTAQVQVQTLKQNVRAAGVLGTKEEIKLSFKIGGVIDKILADQGQSVTQGQLLATLNLREINSQVEQAQQGFEKAERDLKRAKALFADSVATLEQLQNATTGYEVAKSGLAAALFNKQYASIYAPISGRIVRKLSSENELINPGVPVFIISTPGKGWVLRVGLADKDVVLLQNGNAASVNFAAYPSVTFPAVISEIAATATPGTGTYETELIVNPMGKNFVTGLVGKASIVPSQAYQYKLVPIESLLEADGAHGIVYVLQKDGKHVVKKKVTIAFIHGGQVALMDGVEAGDQVVTEGASYVNESTIVGVQ